MSLLGRLRRGSSGRGAAPDGAAFETALDWRAYEDSGLGDAYADVPKHGGDFAKAVAVCINARQCETRGKTVMCPSFKVSGEPLLSTGGRVRLLKAALSADDPAAALSEPEIARAMALCVACKGCKRECEASVDMALIKAEHAAQKVKREGMSLRARLFAFTPRWLHHAPFAARLIRWRNRSPALRWLGERLLGLAAGPALPEPARAPFAAGRARSEAAREAAPGAQRGEASRDVVLFIDSFTRYFEPDIAEAALTVLRAGGYRPHLAEPAREAGRRPLCCGRTFLAQGRVDLARAEVARLLRAIGPQLRLGRLVIGLEASCVLGLRDDALALGLAEEGLGEEMTLLSKQLMLFEEFLAKEIMAKRLDLPLGAAPGAPALVHGHCHQKAVGAMKAMRRVLKHLPDQEFEMIEAGCCGMAGTFGIEAEHAAMATAMAEEGLAPALRQAGEATVVANGFSCRQQIRAHGAARPRHLAELVRDALAAEAAPR